MQQVEGGRYFFGPSSLESKWRHGEWGHIPFVGFEDHNFASRRSYSQFMLQPDLYDEFRDYEFVLVCQTDALLVKGFEEDELSQVGFDYVGALWTPGHLASWNPWSQEFSQTALRLTRRRLRIGNGGLSLRRVSAFRRAARLLPKVVSSSNEDIVFSYFSRMIGIRLPTLSVAERYFMEQEASSWEPADPIPEVHGFHALSKFNPLLEEELLEFFDVGRK